MNHYVSLARQAVEHYVQNGELLPLPEGLPSKLYNRQAGVFVTIIKDDELRSCIGTYQPTQENLAQEIIASASAAASKDHRFGPITSQELPHLSYKGYVLETPEQISELSQLDPRQYGLMVQDSLGRSALLLPGLEGIDTPTEQLEAACRKACIDLERSDITLYRFSAQKFVS